MIAIVKYNAGNTKSVENAVRRLGFDCIVTDNALQLEQATKVILPGVGEASSAMQHLKKTGLDQCLKDLKQPVLGVCLGLQLLCKRTEEGDTPGLGIFDIEVRKFPALQKVPHMGWNSITFKEDMLFRDFPTAENVYFVHSYYAEISENTIASCDYILPFSAALKKNNFYAVQFHPEKSGTAGQLILKNFLEICE